jgi:hypothetical protein
MSAKIEVIDNHSVRMDLLTKRPILDAGARGLRFARHFQALGHEVVALDPSPEVEMDGSPGIVMYPVALVAPWQAKMKWYLNMAQDPEAYHLTLQKQEVEVGVIDLFSITPKGEIWDVVKLNIEGSEYDVLAAWPGPIARQITVSFHQHTARRWPEKQIDYLVRRLGDWYTPVRHEKDARFCAGENWWDSLFVLKELANG